jgi:hypothetical protein
MVSNRLLRIRNSTTDCNLLISLEVLTVALEYNVCTFAFEGRRLCGWRVIVTTRTTVSHKEGWFEWGCTTSTLNQWLPCQTFCGGGSLKVVRFRDITYQFKWEGLESSNIWVLRVRLLTVVHNYRVWKGNKLGSHRTDQRFGQNVTTQPGISEHC